MFFRKRNANPSQPQTTPVILTDDVDQALAEARRRLDGTGADAWLQERTLAFATSLLTAVGEDPATPRNQVLVHQMAVEQIVARQALVNARK
jgi:hypothetical protein